MKSMQKLDNDELNGRKKVWKISSKDKNNKKSQKDSTLAHNHAIFVTLEAKQEKWGKKKIVRVCLVEKDGGEVLF